MSGQTIAQLQRGATATFTPVPGGVLQRKCACGQHTAAGGECAECKKKREGTLQRSAISTAPTSAVPPIVHEVLSSPGQPLDSATRVYMEPRFGHDFSRVRVRNDARAAESARAVNAQAFTVGHDIVFGGGQYAPETATGKSLLAHELTHVVQQETNTARGKLQLAPSEGPAEYEAEKTATRVVQGEAQVSLTGVASTAVQPGYIQRRVIHQGRILNEGSCEHLACRSIYGTCNPDSSTECPEGSAAVRHNPSCTHRRFSPLFTCDVTPENAISTGCNSTSTYMALPRSRFDRRRHCGQDLVICGNGRFTHGQIRDRSEREAWEVSPAILGALGITGGDITNGSVYGDETDPEFRRDPRCRPASTPNPDAGAGGRRSDAGDSDLAGDATMPVSGDTVLAPESEDAGSRG